MSPLRLGYKNTVASISGSLSLLLAFSRERQLPYCEAALGRGPQSEELRQPATTSMSLEADLLRPANQQVSELGSRPFPIQDLR